MRKIVTASLVTPVMPIKVWYRTRTAGQGKQRKHVQKLDLSEYTPDKYLLSHSTIIAGVVLEENGYYIAPTHSKWVNDNGNAWDNEVLLDSYKTFVFGENYVEHVQRLDLSRGKILDAVARVVKSQNGDSITVYVDILVATDRKHKDLCAAIEAGRVNKMSMGCLKPTGLVTMADGTQREIQYIQVGDWVLTEKGRARRVTAVHTYDVENERLIQAQVEGMGSKEKLELTGEHPLPLIRASKEEARKNGRWNPVIGSVNEGHKPAGLEAAYFTVESMRQDDLLKVVYPTEVWVPEGVSENDAELLGMLAGDGITNYYGNDYPVEQHVNNEEAGISERGKIVMEEVCGGFQEEEHRECSKVSVLRKSDKGTFEFLGKYLKGRNAKTKAFTTEVLFWPKNLQRALIRGYINADGDKNKVREGLKTESRSRDLRDQIHLMLLRQGIPATKTVLHHEKPTGFAKEPYDMYAVLVSKSYTAGWMTLKVDAEKETEFKCERAVRLETGEILRKVKSIKEEEYTGKVYNLSVEEDETFVHAGVAVHNCTVSHTRCSRCGKIFTDDDKDCTHIENELGQKFRDKNGVMRITAELCGVKSIPGSNVFTEASWVYDPAFGGAHRRGTIGEAAEGTPLTEVLSTYEIVHDRKVAARRRAASRNGRRTAVANRLFEGICNG